MRICGIELKSNNALISVIETSKNSENVFEYIDTKIKKFTLNDDEKKVDILNLKNEIESFLSQNKIDKIALKKRAKKGNFAGGAVTFKLETILQLNEICELELISSQAITKYTKQNDITFPSSLNKYQEQAYLSSLILV